MSWLVPLYLFMSLRSGWSVVIAALLTLGVVHILRNLQNPVKQTPALSSGARVQACVMAGAAIEVGLVAAGTYHPVQAVFLIILATAIVGWAATNYGRHGHPARGLITIFFAIVLTSGAPVRRTGLTPGDSLFGVPIDPVISASLIGLQKAFGDGPIMPIPVKGPSATERSRAEIEGLSHRGIYLWPEEKKEVTLVPPLPSLGRMAFGKDHMTPLTIPFYGAYWFFRFPFNRPPIDSLVVHGSPAVRRFLSNDRTPLWEEAHQDLKTAFDVTCCTKIEIDFTNAEHHSELVEIQLVLVSHAKQGKIEQALDTMHLTTRPAKVAIPETVPFTLPANSKVKLFDELVVKMRMMTPFSMDSAQVAIERFRLVPKGRR